VRGLPLHHRPVGEGCAEACSECRADDAEENGQSGKADRFRGGRRYRAAWAGSDEPATTRTRSSTGLTWRQDHGAAADQVPGSGAVHDELEDFDRAAVSVRRAHGLRENDQRHGDGADHGPAEELGYHVQHQGWGFGGQGGGPGAGLEHDHKIIQTFGDTVEVETPSELLPCKQKASRPYIGRWRCGPDCTRSTS
jgi:hypothetical protein